MEAIRLKPIFLSKIIFKLFFLFLITLVPLSSGAVIAPQWIGGTSTFGTNINWTTPATAPGTSLTPFDTAVFSGTATNLTAANTTTITLDTMQFNAGAAAYTITNSGAAGNITFSGFGIINNSSNTQNITNNLNTILFNNNATPDLSFIFSFNFSFYSAI